MSLHDRARGGARGPSSVPAALRPGPTTFITAWDELRASLDQCYPRRTGLPRAPLSENLEIAPASLTNPIIRTRRDGLIAFAPSAKRGSATWMALAVTASVLGSATARAANDTAANGQDISKQELMKRLEIMERRVQTLETRLKQQNQAAPASPTPNRRRPSPPSSALFKSGSPPPSCTRAAFRPA